ncbi:MAG: S41 family peptidase [Thermoanaerobaculia bacterium]
MPPLTPSQRPPESPDNSRPAVDPNRSRRRFLAISMLVLLPLVGGVLWSSSEVGDKEPDPDSLYRYLAIFSETLNLVRQTYVEQTDMGTLLAGAMEGSTDALDPYSIYLPSAVSVAEEKELVPGARHSGLVVLKDRGVAYVASVEEGSPAVTAQFESGDILSRIGGRPTRQMPVWEINRQFVPADGRELDIEVVRRGETKSLKLMLSSSPAPPPSLTPVQGFPLLRVPRLDAESVEATRALLVKATADGSPKLLIDLRGQTGDPAAGYALAGLFVQGDLGTLKEKDKVEKTFTSPGPVAYHGQIALLVDSSSAGAAEVLSAVLQQKAGAKLIGVPTFGWAGERSRIELESGARLYLTTAFFAGPDGKALSQRLTPDLLVDDFGRDFEERDKPLSQLILERAIRFLSGETQVDEKKAA